MPGESARRANLATAVVTLADLNALASRPEVTHIELGEPLAPPTPTRAPGPVPAPPPAFRQVGHPELHHDGEGVLIGIIDVEGFDYEVLLGAVQTIERNRPFIAIELAWARRAVVEAFFDERGYVLLSYDVGRDRFGRDNAGGQSGERNSFAVPKERLASLPLSD